MRTSDQLARLSGAILGITSLWNVGVSALWVLAYWWMIVGLLWLVPLALGLVNLALSLFSVARGHHRLALAGPCVGLFVSLCNFNFLSMFIDLLGFALMLGASVARSTER